MTTTDTTEKTENIAPASAGYEHDFYAWAMNNARLLRERRFSEIDVNNVAEELETLGRSEKRELINRLAVLLAHLLKWQFQPQRRSKSWRVTIKEQRLKLIEHLVENPSLRANLTDTLSKAYGYAVLQAVKETPLDETDFPITCPYTLDEIFQHDYLPRSG